MPDKCRGKGIYYSPVWGKKPAGRHKYISAAKAPSFLYFFSYSHSYLDLRMRRGSASYICILLTVGLVYFGSLYITARLSGSTTCFSIFQKEKTHSMPRDESQAVVAYPPVPEPIVVTSVAACPPAPSLAPSAAKPISTSQPASIAAPGKKQANAVIVILCRNSELLAMRRTMREFEEYAKSVVSNLILSDFNLVHI